MKTPALNEPGIDDLPLPSQLGAFYTLRSIVGRGAMGTVYAADGPKGECAIKVLVRQEPEAIARFIREIGLLEDLDHPAVVRVLDHGATEDGRPYFVMPLYRQGDLGVHLARVGALAPEVALPIALAAMRGVQAANARGIIHRDVKPSNLLFDETPKGTLGTYVVDFGLATAGGGAGGLTMSGALMGTPHYVSPEQSTAPKSVDARADVWSFGMVLYHMLAGAPALANAGEFMSMLVGQHKLAPLQSRAPWVAGPVARVVHASILRDKDARIPDLGELALALEMAVGYELARRDVHLSDMVAFADDRKTFRAAAAAPIMHWQELLRA